MPKEAAVFLTLSMLVVLTGVISFAWISQDAKICPDGYTEQSNEVCMKKEGTDESA